MNQSDIECERRVVIQRPDNAANSEKDEHATENNIVDKQQGSKDGHVRRTVVW
jgi:hypothetical protein